MQNFGRNNKDTMVDTEEMQALIVKKKKSDILIKFQFCWYKHMYLSQL